MLHSEVVDNPTLNRFELHEDGKIAFLIYERVGGSVRLIHTEVPSSLRGQGIGSKLVAGVVRWAEHNKKKVIPLCPFVIEYLKTHPKHLDIVDENYRHLIQEPKPEHGIIRHRSIRPGL